MASALYLGLMSGTSQDSVDAALVDFSGTRFRRVVATYSIQYPDALRQRLLKLARTGHALPLGELGELDGAVADRFVAAARGVLRASGIRPSRINAIGSHGQTVFHDPAGRARTSIQLGDPNRIAAQTGMTTIADFRRRDVALGGQGAPLVPAFHHAVFASAREPRAVVNIGGIANVTVLPNARAPRVSGFDTGPGNALMDEWIHRHRGQPYDAAGRWGATGTVHSALLAALLGEGYFRQAPPKSTGRDFFNLEWALRRFPRLPQLPAADVQRTFCELTARTIADAIRRAAPRTRRALVCGGGGSNVLLMQRLQAQLPRARVESTAAHGVDGQWVEAAAFAWLAMRTMNGLPGNVPKVTGASRPAILGGIYRA